MLDSKFENTGNVLSCSDTFEVILPTKDVSSYQWRCGTPDENGWFLIEHLGTGSGNFLTNKGSGQLKVEGTTNSLITKYSIKILAEATWIKSAITLYN